jgi:hypothetical protein
MQNNGWGTWIRTKIDGVRVRAGSLILQDISSNWVGNRLNTINGLRAVFQPAFAVGSAPA